MTTTITLRPGEPERDFGQIAAWFALLEEGALSEQGLKEYYEKRRERLIECVAEDEQGRLLGFYWIYRSDPETCYIDLLVEPGERKQGVGGRLYQDLEGAVRDIQAKVLRANVSDADPESRAFADRRGFTERSHSIAMALDLEAFDDRPYEALIARLKSEGFQFTSMEELGNTEEAQRKLYLLNEATGRDIPGSDGAPSWASFEDFQQSVCQAGRYRPGGQMVVIDTATGAWAAMSAITRLEGTDHAYNLHTGVDRPYRGRKIAQAVKVLALRYARNVLKVSSVRTHHNAQNAPMFAIDQKFGYRQTPGVFAMAKILE